MLDLQIGAAPASRANQGQAKEHAALDAILRVLQRILQQWDSRNCVIPVDQFLAAAHKLLAVRFFSEAFCSRIPQKRTEPLNQSDYRDLVGIFLGIAQDNTDWAAFFAIPEIQYFSSLDKTCFAGDKRCTQARKPVIVKFYLGLKLTLKIGLHGSTDFSLGANIHLNGNVIQRFSTRRQYTAHDVPCY